MLRIVLGHTLRSNSIEEFTLPWICSKACGGQNFQIGVSNWWNKGKNGVAGSNILWMMSGFFSPDNFLDSCVIRRWEPDLEKARCLYLSCHEGSWLNWKANRWGCDQVKHVLQRWNSRVTPGRNLLSEVLGRGHKESRRNVLLEGSGSQGLWPEYGPFMVLRFFKELQRALLCFWRMRDASVLYLDAWMSG